MKKPKAKAWEKCGTVWVRTDGDGMLAAAIYKEEKRFVGGLCYVVPTEYLTPEQGDKTYLTLKDAQREIDAILMEEGWKLEE